MLRRSASALFRSSSFSILLAAASSAAISLVPQQARAEDSLYGTRGGDQMTEREHAIALTFERGHATLVVQRTIHNGLDRHDEAQFWLSIPYGAVATGVRTLGYVKGKPRWYEGELLEAEEAAARYQELTGLGGYYPKDPVLLSWRDPTLLAMQVFPVEPQADKVIEYTLTIPASWREGRWVIELPAMGTATLAADLTLQPGEALDQLFVDGAVVGANHQLELDRGAVIELAPRDPDPVTLSLASVDTGENRHLVQLDVSLAARISEIPERAQIVVALDLSRSRSPEQVEAQRQAAIAYLEHFRDPALAAEVAVIGFDREVHDLTAEFVSAEQAIATLTQALLNTRNGSEIGEALTRASALLADHAPARAPRRIVVMTDFLTASRLTPDALAPIVDRSKAIVHLATVDPGQAFVQRDDSHPWSKLAARTEGVLWTAFASQWDEPDAPASPAAVFEEWARPVRIDDFELDVEGLRFTDAEQLQLGSLLPEMLAEGEGLERIALSSSDARKLIVTGRLWNRSFNQAQRSSDAHGDRWSAMVFGTALLDELSEPEMMTLAMRGKAVSPVTSYLAIEPGVRPSTEGIEAWERSGLGLIGLGNSGLFGSGGGGGRGTGVHFDPEGWLHGEVSDAWRRCGGAGPISVALETTVDEIVNVSMLAPTKLDPAVEVCMQQSIWSIELPGQFDSHFEIWLVQL
jgi:hypothetical protein